MEDEKLKRLMAVAEAGAEKYKRIEPLASKKKASTAEDAPTPEPLQSGGVPDQLSKTPSQAPTETPTQTPIAGSGIATPSTQGTLVSPQSGNTLPTANSVMDRLGISYAPTPITETQISGTASSTQKYYNPNTTKAVSTIERNIQKDVAINEMANAQNDDFYKGIVNPMQQKLDELKAYRESLPKQAVIQSDYVKITNTEKQISEVEKQKKQSEDLLKFINVTDTKPLVNIGDVAQLIGYDNIKDKPELTKATTLYAAFVKTTNPTEYDYIQDKISKGAYTKKEELEFAKKASDFTNQYYSIANTKAISKAGQNISEDELIGVTAPVMRFFEAEVQQKGLQPNTEEYEALKSKYDEIGNKSINSYLEQKVGQGFVDVVAEVKKRDAQIVKGFTEVYKEQQLKQAQTKETDKELEGVLGGIMQGGNALLRPIYKTVNSAAKLPTIVSNLYGDNANNYGVLDAFADGIDKNQEALFQDALPYSSQVTQDGTNTGNVRGVFESDAEAIASGKTPMTNKQRAAAGALGVIETTSLMFAMGAVGKPFSAAAEMVGATEATAGAIGTTMGGTIATFDDYQKAGAAAGLNRQEAAVYGLGMGTFIGALENISPLDGLLKSEVRIGTMKAYKEFLDAGLSSSASFKNAMLKTAYGVKDVAIKITAENAQEISQTIAEKFGNSVTNLSTGSSLDTEVTAQEMKETVLMTTLSTGLVSSNGSFSSANGLAENVLFNAVGNYDATVDMINNGVNSGKYTQADANIMYANIEDAKKHYDSIPEDARVADMPKILSALVARGNIEKELQDGKLAAPFIAKKEAQIANIDKILGEMYDKREEENNEATRAKTGISVDLDNGGQIEVMDTRYGAEGAVIGYSISDNNGGTVLAELGTKLGDEIQSKGIEDVYRYEYSEVVDNEGGKTYFKRLKTTEGVLQPITEATYNFETKTNNNEQSAENTTTQVQDQTTNPTQADEQTETRGLANENTQANDGVANAEEQVRPIEGAGTEVPKDANRNDEGTETPKQNEVNNEIPAELTIPSELQTPQTTTIADDKQSTSEGKVPANREATTDTQSADANGENGTVGDGTMDTVQPRGATSSEAGSVGNTAELTTNEIRYTNVDGVESVATKVRSLPNGSVAVVNAEGKTEIIKSENIITNDSKEAENGKASTEENVANTESTDSNSGEANTQPIGTDATSDVVAEIKSKKLTHVRGLSMGTNQADGMYVSTEKNNRYETETNKAEEVEVEVQNPIVIDDSDIGMLNLRTKILNENIGLLDLADFQEIAIPTGTATIDDLSDKGVKTLAKIVTNELKKQGYDSIYFKESDNQEGELIIFDKSKTKFKQNDKSNSKTEPEQNGKRASSASKISTISPKSKQRAKSTGQNLPIVRRKSEANQKQITDAYGHVLMFFVNGGKINESAIISIYGDRSSRGFNDLKGRKASMGEKKPRTYLIDNNKGKGIEATAEDIFNYVEESPDVFGNYELSDFVSALEDVISSFNNVTDMVNYVNKNYEAENDISAEEKYGAAELEFYKQKEREETEAIDMAEAYYEGLTEAEKQELIDGSKIAFEEFEETIKEVEKNAREKSEIKKDLDEKKQELSIAENEYEKTNNAYNNELKRRQPDMFRGSEQRMFNDNAEAEKRIKNKRDKLSELKKQVKELQAAYDNLLDGQTAVDFNNSEFQKDVVSETPPLQRTTKPLAPIDKTAFKTFTREIKKAFPKSKVITTTAEFEAKLKSDPNTKELKTPKGTIYGAKFADGTIYLNEDKMNAQTPIHEVVGHIYVPQILESARSGDAKATAIYKKLKGVINEANPRGKSWLQEVKDSSVYASLGTVEQEQEAMAQMIGEVGEQLLSDINNVGNSTTSDNSYAKAKAVLREIYEYIKSKFGKGFADASIEDIAKMSVGEFVQRTIGSAKVGEYNNTKEENTQFQATDIKQTVKETLTEQAILNIKSATDSSLITDETLAELDKLVENGSLTQDEYNQLYIDDNFNSIMPELYSAKNAFTNANRERLGKAPLTQLERGTDAELIQTVKDAMEGGDPYYNPKDILSANKNKNAKEILLTEKQVLVIEYAKKALYERQTKASFALKEAREMDDYKAVSGHLFELSVIKEELDDYEQLIKDTGTNTALALRIRSIVFDEYFNPTALKKRIEALKGETLSYEENEKLEAVIAENKANMDALKDKVAQLQEALGKAQKNAISKHVAQKSNNLRTAKSKPTVEGGNAKVQSALDKMRAKLGLQNSGVQFQAEDIKEENSEDPLAILLKTELQEMLEGFLETDIANGINIKEIGEKKLGYTEEKLKQVQDELIAQGIIADANELPIMEIGKIVTDYGKLKKSNPEDLPTIFRQIKRDMKLLAKEADLLNGILPKLSGFKHDAMTSEQRGIISRVNDLLYKAGVIPDGRSTENLQKTALDKAKTAIQNKIDDINAGIVREKKNSLIPDAKLLELRDTLKALSAKIAKPRLSNEKKLEIAINGINSIRDKYQEAVNGQAEIVRADKLNSPEKTEALRQLSEARDAYNEMLNMLDPMRADNIAEATRLKAIEAEMNRIQNDIDNKTERTTKEPLSTEAITAKNQAKAKLKEEYDAMLDRLDPERRNRIKEESRLDAMAKGLLKLEEAIKSGVEITTGERFTTVQIEAKRKEMAEARKSYNEMLNAKNPMREMERKLKTLKTTLANKATKTQETLDEVAKRIRENKGIADLLLPKTQEEKQDNTNTEKLKSEIISINQANAKSQTILNTMELQAKYDALNNWERFANNLKSLYRSILILSPTTEIKVATAGVAGPVLQQINELGTLLSAPVNSLVFKKIFKAKAQRHHTFDFEANKAAWRVLASPIVGSPLHDSIWADFKTKLKGGVIGAELIFDKNLSNDIETTSALKLLSYNGNSHAAMKYIPFRTEFERTFMTMYKSHLEQFPTFNEQNIEQHNIVMEHIGKQAYIAGKRESYMSELLITKGFNDAINMMNIKGDKVQAALLGLKFPIIKVAMNFVDSTLEYNALYGAAKIGKVLLNARMGLKNETSMSEGVKSEEIDEMLRLIKKGAVGQAAYLLGYVLADSLGGLWFDDWDYDDDEEAIIENINELADAGYEEAIKMRDKLKKGFGQKDKNGNRIGAFSITGIKNLQMLKFGDIETLRELKHFRKMKPAELSIMGVHIPHFMTHLPLLSMVQAGATHKKYKEYMDYFNNNPKNKDKDEKSGAWLEANLIFFTEVLSTMPFYGGDKSGARTYKEEGMSGVVLNTVVSPFARPLQQTYGFVNWMADGAPSDQGYSREKAPDGVGEYFKMFAPGTTIDVIDKYTSVDVRTKEEKAINKLRAKAKLGNIEIDQSIRE